MPRARPSRLALCLAPALAAAVTPHAAADAQAVEPTAPPPAAAPAPTSAADEREAGLAPCDRFEGFRFVCRSHELGVNAFRAPSIGLEYRLGPVSIHAGGYPTILSENNADRGTTWFVKTGLTFYFLPLRLYGQRASELYVSASYVRGLDDEWERENGFMAELGWRWMVWNGINLRIGVAFLVGGGTEDVEINPTPGLGFSFPLPS